MQPNYPSEIIGVLVKYALDQEPLSWPERQLLEEWRSRSAEHRELPDQLRDPQWREQHRQEISEAPSAEMWENISRYIDDRKIGIQAEVVEKLIGNRISTIIVILLSIIAVIGLIDLVRGWIK